MSLQQTNLKARQPNALMMFSCISAVIALVVGMLPLNTAELSPADLQTVEKIHEVIGWAKDDCKKMKLADFHLENDPPYLRNISRKLAEQCMSGN